MRKAILAGLATLLGAGCAEADLAEIRRSGTLRVLAVEANSPMPGKSPFLAVTKESASGLDAELLRGFARTQGLGLAIVMVHSWDALLPALLDGKGDVIAGNVAASETSRLHVDFSAETLPTRAVLLSYSPHGPFAGVEQLASEKLGAVPGTLAMDALLVAGVPRASISEVEGPQALLDSLREGRVRAAAVELIAALEAERRDEKFRRGGFVGPLVSLGFGVRKDCPRLREALDAHIGALKRSPSWYRLLLASFGPSAPAAVGQLKTEKH